MKVAALKVTRSHWVKRMAKGLLGVLISRGALKSRAARMAKPADAALGSH